LLNAVMAMYEGAQTVVQTAQGDSKAYVVKVQLHQDPLLCETVMEVITQELLQGSLIRRTTKSLNIRHY